LPEFQNAISIDPANAAARDNRDLIYNKNKQTRLEQGLGEFHAFERLKAIERQ